MTEQIVCAQYENKILFHKTVADLDVQVSAKIVRAGPRKIVIVSDGGPCRNEDRLSELITGVFAKKGETQQK